MLTWINGAFGAGKTHTAHELLRRHGRGHVADPELLGYAINKTLPPSARGDFQDRPQWRSVVADTLEQAHAAQPDGEPLIVPMTVVDPVCFDQTVGELRRRGVDVRHYALIASPATIAHRLDSRVSSVAARLLCRDETWAHAQIDRCTTALADDMFGVHVDTDHRSLDEVVETVAAHADLDLPHGRLSGPAASVRRLTVAARHIRF